MIPAVADVNTDGSSCLVLIVYTHTPRHPAGGFGQRAAQVQAGLTLAMDTVGETKM